MKFMLGTHQPGWLGRLDVPLFVSRRRLVDYKKLPRARASWGGDSGGFMELSLFGEWTVEPAQYVGEVRRFRDEIGRLDFAAIQDWMCEPWIIQKTGLSVEEHQKRTIDNYETLLSLAPELPWLPVLQGWRESDYLRHLDDYQRRGHNLAALTLVGLGSVCRRQATGEAARIVERLSREGLKLHGFGFKQQGLEKCGQLLASSDSMAWSFAARRSEPLPGHEARHKNCANCIDYAMRWRTDLLRRLDGADCRRRGQLDLFRRAS